MRAILKELTEEDCWVYGIREDDFHHAVRLVKEMIQARYEQYKRKEGKVRLESPDIADDILDDVAYYSYTDNQYLWHFALWRLQGLLEAVIVHQLIDDEKCMQLTGLKAKLYALRKVGRYSVSEDEINELMLWAKLRNAISHAPPEQYRPSPLGEEDVIEYQQLVLRFYSRWIKEKSRS